MQVRALAALGRQRVLERIRRAAVRDRGDQQRDGREQDQDGQQRLQEEQHRRDADRRDQAGADLRQRS